MKSTNENLEETGKYLNLKGNFLIAISILMLIFFICFGLHQYSNVKNYKEEKQWVSEGIDNCVIENQNSIQGNDVYKIMLQTNIYDRKATRALFYDSHGKQYEAIIDIDVLDGLSYIVTLDNKNIVWVTFDYKNRTCNVTSFTDNSETLFDKKGYMGFSTDFNSLGDWEFAKEINNLDKKIHKKK